MENNSTRRKTGYNPRKEVLKIYMKSLGIMSRNCHKTEISPLKPFLRLISTFPGSSFSSVNKEFADISMLWIFSSQRREEETLQTHSKKMHRKNKFDEIFCI